MSQRRRAGIILLLVLVVVAVLSLACLGFASLMLGERNVAQVASRQSQARSIAESGVELAKQFLNRTPEERKTVGGTYDNPQRFRNVLVVDDEAPQDRGRFTLVAPRIEDRTVSGVCYGLQDESTRINLAVILKWDSAAGTGSKSGTDSKSGSNSSGGSTSNTASNPNTSSSSGTGSTPGTSISKAVLMALPGMRDEIADAILDWIDQDDTTCENGAETSYYGSLSPPYAPRNGPPATIEELLLVRGVTPALLFGKDAARMGLIPAGAVADGAIDGVDNGDGSMEHGWAAYFTLWSAESTLKPDGATKINLNSDDLQTLHNNLSSAIDEKMATFIVAYRQSGAKSGGEEQGGKGGKSSGGGQTTSGTLDFSKKATTTIKSILDLVGTSTNAQFVGQKEPTTLKSPLTEDTATMNTYFPKLLDNTMVSDSGVRGRININHAPRAVLMCIPEITSDVVDQIIAKRSRDPLNAPEDQNYETWPLTEGVVPLKTMKALQPYINAGGAVYRVQSIGSFDSGGTNGRVEAILDATKSPTKQLFWKDISRLSEGFPVEPAAEENQSAN